MSLQVWLPLINDIHNQGTNNCIPESSGISTNTAGKIGSCQYLSGAATSYINTNYSTNIGTNDFSIAMWLKLPTISSGSYFAICTSKTATAASAGFGIYWNYSQKKFLWSTADGSGGTEIWMAAAVDSIVYDKWIHLVMIRNNNDSKKGYFYINGTRYELTSIPAIRNIATDTKMHIGKCTNGSYPTKMYINDFRIYDHALSAAEVREIAQGLVLHYKLNQPIGLTDIILNQDTYAVYNNYAGSGTTGTLTNLSETFNGHVVRREVMTPNGTSVNNFKSALGSHGVYGHRQTFLANTKYVFWIYYRPISHTDIRAGGVASNIGGWTEIPPVAVGDGWYRVGQYRNGTVTTDKTDNIFTSFCTPTAASGVPITIDWAAPHLLAGTTEIPEDDSFMGNDYVEDSSGYGHHGLILGTATLSSDTAHYNSSITLPSGANAINCGRGGMVTDSITVNIWLKATGWGNPVSCTEGGGWNFEADGDYFRFPVYIAGVGYKYGKSTHTRAQICNGQWHMLTGIYDKINQKVQIYVDGQLDNDYAAGTSNNIGYNGSNVIWIGAEASSSATAYASRQMVGSFSDFRIYCTALDADAVRKLYEVGAKIDNKANFHTFEISENDTNKLTKTGIMYDNMEESIMTLPDGSCWQLLMFHYVDNGNNLFTSSNATNCNDFGLFSRLKDIDNFKIGTQYEFYGLQDGNAYRWIQTNAPMTTTAVTGFSAVSGYTSPGAGICKCNGSTVLARTGTTSNWWNAVGCYTKYNGGIPGYAQTICKEYMALYARIEKADVKISNQTLNASKIIEL